MTDRILPSSFRDPKGFVFSKKGTYYRQVNKSYKKAYNHLIDSGLYKTLVNAELLIPHEEVNRCLAWMQEAYKTLKPKLIPFISYPYEWSFSQLKAAAFTTLVIQKKALQHGMSLKDAIPTTSNFIKANQS